MSKLHNWYRTRARLKAVRVFNTSYENTERFLKDHPHLSLVTLADYNKLLKLFEHAASTKS